MLCIVGPEACCQTVGSTPENKIVIGGPWAESLQLRAGFVQEGLKQGRSKVHVVMAASVLCF